MLGEIHWNQQQYQWLDSLVADPKFADRVDDIVMEFGNSLYQKSVDRYIAGEAVPIEEVQRAWRNVIGMGPPPPIYGDLYKAVREANLRRRGKQAFQKEQALSAAVLLFPKSVYLGQIGAESIHPTR
jgi:hypothetical protein